MLQGGRTAATRLASGSRESQMGFDFGYIVTESPGNVFDRYHEGFRGEFNVGNGQKMPVLFNEDAVRSPIGRSIKLLFSTKF